MALVKCRECQQEISDKAAACPHCGCPVNSVNASVSDDKCPNCGSQISRGSVLCSMCGTVVDARSSSVPSFSQPLVHQPPYQQQYPQQQYPPQKTEADKAADVSFICGVIAVFIPIGIGIILGIIAIAKGKEARRLGYVSTSKSFPGDKVRNGLGLGWFAVIAYGLFNLIYLFSLI